MQPSCEPVIFGDSQFRGTTTPIRDHYLGLTQKLIHHGPAETPFPVQAHKHGYPYLGIAEVTRGN